MGALTGRRGPQGGGQFSPKDGSCACHLGVNLNPIWSYWPRNFQPMYLIDRSSAFQRVMGRYRGLGTNQQTSLFYLLAKALILMYLGVSETQYELRSCASEKS